MKIVTGISDLDSAYKRFDSGCLSIITCKQPYSGTGYHQLAYQFASKTAVEQELPVLIFHTGRQYATYPICHLISHFIGKYLPGYKLIRGCFSDDEWPHFTNAIDILASAKIRIDFSHYPYLSEVINKTEDTVSLHGPGGLVIIDKINLLRSFLTKEPSDEDWRRILIKLKKVAHKLNIHIILIMDIDSGDNTDLVSIKAFNYSDIVLYLDKHDYQKDLVIITVYSKEFDYHENIKAAFDMTGFSQITTFQTCKGKGS
ncbi:hypothetical protein BROC_02220 [Candidatus Brocadiaceae bacterium]|nr:hypothetical protein BROC_02220 [Candidatus Brocadiaceae bacterium]